MIKLYTSNWCSYCVAAKRFFEEHKIKYQEINIEDENISRQDLLELSGGYTVPQIIINDEPIGGFNQLLILNQEDYLKLLINQLKMDLQMN